MEFQIDKETRAALEANLNIRFFFRLKMKPGSRHSSDIIPWAQTKADKVTKAMLEAIGRQAPNLNVDMQLNIVSLLRNRPYALLCYDLFLDEGDEQVRGDFSQAVRQPIYEVIKRGKTFHVLRSKKMDAIVAGEYEMLQHYDEGPRPSFTDGLNPPLYDERKRVEKPKDDGSPDPDEPEAGGAEEKGMPKDRPAEDEPREQNPEREEAR
ncbi:hypothetical protein C8A00DRAFT_44895 [Chaetomidium leptoderma]|uniref:Uncharacterized protein n=1 Tax=Chaetomidium leptoderma TaxID=669021 RepID=A0AAN6VI72_9PEZI|nr:hypothetical protein C8A00DRAFT_44895 [Chaetomidium leptoderma]